VPHHQATCRRCTKIKGKRKFKPRNKAKGILRDLEDIERNMVEQR
jgi:hypothetical protein